MTSPHSEVYEQLRTAARRIFDAALAAAEPGALVSRLLAVEGRTVMVDGEPFHLGEQGRVILLAAGKAAGPMIDAAGEILGPLASDGLAVVRERPDRPFGALPLIVAGHPVPDDNSVHAANRMLGLARSAGPGDMVLCLFSGGASSLLTAPAPPLELEQVRHTTKLLIGCGAGIHLINCVRKHLSSIKGGLLARAVRPAALANLLLSDVVGDSPEVIASGPTTPDPTTFADALRVLENRGLDVAVPGPVLHHLHSGNAGEIGETPGPGDPCFHGSVTRVAGSNIDALRGAAAEARNLGFRVVTRGRPVTGEAAEAASLFGESAVVPEAIDEGKAPTCFLSGGETTVTLPRRHGLGGRNMELALAAAPLLAGQTATLLLSAGTDGSDGPTTAAGAFTDNLTIDRAARSGLDHRSALRNHDSYGFFEALGDLLVTGPTLTNVQDLQILLRDPRSGSQLTNT